MISEKSVGYNHLADQKEKNKISFVSHKLKKIPINQLPNYICNNKDRYKQFIEK